MCDKYQSACATSLQPHEIKKKYEVWFDIMITMFISTNSADPDKMPHIATFYLGLHCYTFISDVLTYYHLYVLYPCLCLPLLK